ncbi:TPA: pentapeptide repeat-containing protein [Campylobacter coli]|nr:pentapeptide repeat-containing protein [Campylobacter coli]
MEVFDEELAQYGIFVKHARKSIEKEKISVFGNAEIETIDIKILQEKGIAHLHIMDSEFKGALSVQDGYLNFNFLNVSFMNTVVIRGVSFDYFILQQCTFENIFVLDQVSCKNEISFFGTKFNKLVHFVNSDFAGKVNFTEVEFFDKVDFNNIEVKNHINLFHLIFWKVFEINIARLNNLTIAKKTIFHDEVIFLEVGVENIVHICDVKFENKTTFNIKEFGKLEFLNNQVLGEIDFTKSSGKKALIKKSSFEGNTILGISLENLSLVDLNFKEVSLFINNFLYTQNIKFKDIIFEKLVLQKELFEKSVNFERCIFLQDVNFKDYTFNEIAFNTCTFKESAYFNNSNFTKGVDFHECEFEKTACFYGVKFDETSNFSQALFKGNINIINSNLNFDFTKLDKKIRLLSSQGEGKYDYEIANDFRDSFRTFKSALIKDNNFLDASNFHKYELYCKEIELKNKKATTFKDIVDRYQLLFYRKLCDHHTDLLLNLRWLVVVVGFFVSVLFILRYGDGNLLQFFNKDNDLLKILKAMLNIKALNDSNVTYLILLYSFIGLFFVRTFFIFYYLVIFILMLAMSPYNLFSVVNFVTKDQSSSSLENIITVAYTLIMILVLFSLQKTARKNSIVPS